MEFAIAEWVQQSFPETCAVLRTQFAEALRDAAPAMSAGLHAEAGGLEVRGPETAIVRIAWRDLAGNDCLDVELRVLGLNRGAEPVTELLMLGHGTAGGSGRPRVLAWAHRLLDDLADHPHQVAQPSGPGRRERPPTPPN